MEVPEHQKKTWTPHVFQSLNEWLYNVILQIHSILNPLTTNSFITQPSYSKLTDDMNARKSLLWESF